MTLIVQTRTETPIRSPEHPPRPLERVMVWELRRFFASRLFWFQTFGFWGLLLLVIWALHTAGHTDKVIGNEQIGIYLAGTSAEGLLRSLPVLLIILALLLPFLTADGVTRDMNRRTYELLMTTALPTWAYVLGRYLASLIISLGLALLLLISILGLGELAHLTDSTYPLPQFGTVLLLWTGMVFSGTILVSSVGFALSTLLPRLSIPVKVVIMVVWVVGAVIMPIIFHDAPSLPVWYVNWDPTSGITTFGLLRSYPSSLSQAITTQAQLVQYTLGAENQMPNLSGWFAPHLLLAGASLVLVLIAALAFKRSREVFN